ncbi:MAG TPA: sodium:proton antiporter [Phycisphaerales bacterium]|nr:sodium:proton antiporter [Phycisphaerales bacterium]
MLTGATTTLAFAFGLGAIVSAVSSRVRLPAVLPLLGVGVAVGPSGLGWVDVASVGDAFRALVALSIGLLVFEGGLHLDRNELGRAPRAVLGLLTIGVLTTWLGATGLGVWLLGLDLPIALALGSMLIVTGPTVIQPILRHVRLTPKLHSALSAEAILIDPLGVIVSVVTMEVVLAYYGGAFSGAWRHVMHGVLMPVSGGVLVGIAAGGLGFVALRLLAGAKARPAQSGALNLTAMGVCMLAIAAGEMVAPEGGLVAATIAAVILANTHAVASSDIRKFKEQVATLLVGMLFILLASQIDIARLKSLGFEHVAFIGLLLLVVRPLNVATGMFRSRVAMRDRVFAGLFAPRGIVAASVATLAVARMTEVLTADPRGANTALLGQVHQLDLVVYAVIGVSVTWATISAWPMGRALGVLAGPPRGVMIVGAHRLGREAARALAGAGVPVVLVDFSLRHCDLAARDGLLVVRADATDTERMTELAREHDTGWVFGWTDNNDVDRVVGRWAERLLGTGRGSVGLPELPQAGGVAMGPAGSGTNLRTLERALHEGRLGVEVGPSTGGGVCLLVLQDGRPAMVGTGAVKNGKTETWLALRAREPAPAQQPQAQAATSRPV